MVSNNDIRSNIKNIFCQTKTTFLIIKTVIRRFLYSLYIKGKLGPISGKTIKSVYRDGGLHNGLGRLARTKAAVDY